MPEFDSCPFCDADLRVTGTAYSRLIGIEIQGVYDGVLAWRCPDCKAIWDRFRDRESGIATHSLRRNV